MVTLCCAGDAEKGQIYKGGANDVDTMSNDKKTEPEEVKTEQPVIGGHKEKSVLQAKLTKLAIQIGYAGNINEREDVI